jgi:hypothetical protein
MGALPVYVNLIVMVIDPPGANGDAPGTVIYGAPAYGPLATMPVLEIKVAPATRFVNTD